jgi:L-seryl-tRNA(Ser) seleniumtransferase
VTSHSGGLLEALGVRPVINAAGHYTFLTGSLMPPEVVSAWAEAAGVFVRLDELHDAVGRRIAGRVGSEAAMVTAGAAAALTLGTAACLTGLDEDRVQRLPDTTGMPDEVIIQRSHRFAYDHAVRATGVRLVEVETPDELGKAISARTAMLLFLNLAEHRGRIGAGEFAALGRGHGIPTFIDCAADVPPVANLSRALELGFDLVTFSGGKAIGGPQSAGLLLGRRDLIAAARRNAAPNADTIGRGLKVQKEELLAMLAAIEAYLERDHDAEWREWEERVAAIDAVVSTVPGVVTERYAPPIASHAPHLRIRWDERRLPVTRDEVIRRLRAGEPSIEIVPDSQWAASTPVDGLEVGVWTLRPDEVGVVAERLAAIFREARAG